MDTVILAAGRGSRLAGIAAPFHKPLMVVDGKPLIVRLREQADLNDGTAIIVVSPENALPICQLLEANKLLPGTEVVVQPVPDGPGNAFRRAAPLLQPGAERFMLLCADNVIPDADIEAVRDTSGRLVIGTGVVEAAEAHRFTVVSEDGHVQEKEGDVEHCVWRDGLYRVWLGPLVCYPAPLRRALLKAPGVEPLIGQALGRMGIPPKLVEVDCHDIGVVE